VIQNKENGRDADIAMGSSGPWAGIDVGAEKGFDVAVIDDLSLVAGPTRLTSAAQVVAWLRDERPAVIAVDSPRSPAPDGDLSRQGERELSRRVCGIRYTPDRAALLANKAYYAWILNGFDLYDALAQEEHPDLVTIECFPTATWTRLGWPRGDRSRAQWSGEVMGSLGLSGLPKRMNQDARDAIGAALTARLYSTARTEPYGDIVVPLP
jgi:predicted nuclease with RNAse H fold